MTPLPSGKGREKGAASKGKAQADPHKQVQTKIAPNVANRLGARPDSDEKFIIYWGLEFDAVFFMAINWDSVRRKRVLPAIAGVAKLGSPKGTLATNANFSAAAMT
jgi:hypothetical protein